MTLVSMLHPIHGVAKFLVGFAHVIFNVISAQAADNHLFVHCNSGFYGVFNVWRISQLATNKILGCNR